MDTPDTPAPIGEIKNEFKMISDTKKEYLFTVKLTTDIEIIAESIKEIPNKRYKIKYTLEQLSKINKYFKLCERLDEAYQVIIDNINTNEHELKELNNILTFLIKINDKLCGDILFEIPLYIKSDKESMDELFDLIKTLKSENLKLSEEKKENEQKLYNEIKSLKEELQKLKTENDSIKKTSNENYEKLKSQFEKFRKDDEKMKLFGFPSLFQNPKNKCGESSAQFFQTDESYEGSEKSWAHYIVLNHGNGNNYFQVVVRFPFWGGNVQIGHRENNSWKGWKKISDPY